MKEKIESVEYPVFVMRPDSGNPVEVLNKMLDIIEKNDIGYTINSKGYRVLNKYRIIWGDGINEDIMKAMHELMIERNYSVDFGSGGWLMQDNHRDDSKYAIKCYASLRRGELYEVYKCPEDAPDKKSKTGDQVSNFKMRTVYKNGNVLIVESLNTIRNRTN